MSGILAPIIIILMPVMQQEPPLVVDLSSIDDLTIDELQFKLDLLDDVEDIEQAIKSGDFDDN